MAGDKDVEKALLSDGKGGKAAASDEPTGSRPTTPREKFRDKSKGSRPTTPRGEPPAAAPAAAGEKAVGVMESADRTSRVLADMMASAPPVTQLPEAKRMEAYVASLAGAVEGQEPSGLAQGLQSCLMLAIRGFLAVQPWLDYLFKWVPVVWDMLPKNIALMAFGAALCYCGGVYTASIAAVEAFRTMGGMRAKAEIDVVAKQIAKAIEQSEKDDAVDDDGDGVADVKQISSKELVQRKIGVIAKAIDPELVADAVTAINAGLMAVVAT